MNLFEVGGRVEGLETMLESYFGPRGHYNANDRTSNEIPQDSLKSARLSSNKLDDIHSKVSLILWKRKLLYFFD